MSKKFIFAGVLVGLSVLGAVGLQFIKSENQQELTHLSSDTQRYDKTVTIYKDSFEGYRIGCSDHMESLLRRSKIRLNCVDDGADYEQRMKALKSGEANFAFLEVGAYTIEGEKFNYPASLISIIDTSKGADAIVANKKKFNSLEDLRTNPNTAIAVTLNSPSDMFGKITATHFDLETLKNPKNYVSANGSEDVMKKMLRGDVDVGIVWEPHISKLLATGDYVKLVSTAEAQDTIVDALAVSRKYGEENPEMVKMVLASYFKSLKYYTDNPDKLIEEIMTDPVNQGMKEKEVKEMISGINWITLNENCKRWFACDPNDWSAKIKIIDTLEMANKIWYEFKELEENAFPDQDAYTLINSEFMYDLLKNGVGIYSNDEIVDSLERDFAELTPEQWANLKEFGKLKQRGILFLKNNKLRLTSREAIDEVAKDLEHYPNYRLRIEGHTGTLGDSIKNKIISEERAKWVKRYFIQTYSVDSDRIQSIGYGGDKPLKKSRGESDFSKSYQSKLARVSIVLVQEEY
jgi:outer membrane protein OmpA-like peptidoglycan-associated protein/ABC-type taurine transport system substrate-binding protein